MKQLVRKMFVVFPFEVPIYEREGIDVEFVGHPLLEVLSEPQRRPDFCKRWGLEESRKIVGLFPGSRNQEIERIFPAMLGAARMVNRDQGAQIVVGASPSLDIDYLRSFLRGDFPVHVVQNATYDVMKNSDVALVTSGTATLETGYYQTPMIVVYKTSIITYLIGRLLVRVKNIGLVNIVAGAGIVPEYIQWKATPANLAAETADLLNADDRRRKIAESLRVVRERLGTPGASARVAGAIAALA
jgi:lipid-A-disaccharide synthase